MQIGSSVSHCCGFNFFSVLKKKKEFFSTERYWNYISQTNGSVRAEKLGLQNMEMFGREWRKL